MPIVRCVTLNLISSISAGPFEGAGDCANGAGTGLTVGATIFEVGVFAYSRGAVSFSINCIVMEQLGKVLKP